MLVDSYAIAEMLNGDGTIAIWCTKCGVKTGNCRTIRKALATWNKREGKPQP